MPFEPDKPTAKFYADTPVENSGGAAFGIYPKQRATPSTPETKEAVLGASKAAAKGLETLGFFPPSEEKEFDFERIPESAAIGGVAGRYAPQALQAIGKGMQYVPYAPVKAAGRGAEVLGRAIRRYTTPAERTLGTAAGFTAADIGGQTAEQLGLPSVVGMGAGVTALEKGLPALGKAVIGTTQPEVTAAAKRAEDLGFVFEPAQLRKDRPLASPGFTESAKIKNENIATKMASKATGTETENITPAFVGNRMKELGSDYDKIFNRKFTIDGNLVKQLQTMKDFELSVNPAGAGEIAKTADNLIRRFNEEALAQQSGKIENRLKRIIETQQRGGVAPIVRLQKDWRNVRKADSADAPEWARGVEETVKKLSSELGLKVTPEVWFSAPRRQGLYGMATGDGHIVINDALNREGAVATALHEFGHQAEFQLFALAPFNEKKAVIQAFNEQMASLPYGKLTVEQHRPLTAAKYPEETRTGVPTLHHERGYLRDFSEWFAEQTSRWITTTATPTTTVEKFFAKIADTWKTIYQRVVGYVPLAGEVDKFFRANWKGNLVQEVAQEFSTVAKSTSQPVVSEAVTAKIDGKELQRLRSNIQRIARTAPNGVDRNTASNFVKTLDEGLGRYDRETLEKLRETNRMYAATAALADGIEQGFVTQGKISPSSLGEYLAKTSYGYGSGTSTHPLYELGYMGRLLNLRSRAEGVDYPGYDAVAAMLGRGRQAVSSILGGRTQLARDVQRRLSESESK